VELEKKDNTIIINMEEVFKTVGQIQIFKNNTLFTGIPKEGKEPKETETKIETESINQISIIAIHYCDALLRYIMVLHVCNTLLSCMYATYYCDTYLQYIIAIHICDTLLRFAIRYCDTYLRYIFVCDTLLYATHCSDTLLCFNINYVIYWFIPCLIC